MAANGKAFDQVKAILGKLDRQVDEARHRRLGDDELPIRPTRDADPAAAAIDNTPSDGSPDPNGPNAGMPARQSKYGRARPLNRTGEATGAWTAPKARNGHGLDETVG